MITKERLKKLFNYNPETGLFASKSVNRKVGYINENGYVRMRISGKQYYAHQLAWMYVYDEFPIGEIDHINHNTSDNRIENLRHGTKSTNLHNQIKPHKNNKSGLLGVSIHSCTGKYRAQICVDSKIKHLGLFDTADEAHQAYISAKRMYHPNGML